MPPAEPRGPQEPADTSSSLQRLLVTQGITSTKPRLGSCLWTQFPFASPVQPAAPAALCSPSDTSMLAQEPTKPGLENRMETQAEGKLPWCPSAACVGEFIRAVRASLSLRRAAGLAQHRSALLPRSVPPDSGSVPMSAAAPGSPSCSRACGKQLRFSVITYTGKENFRCLVPLGHGLNQDTPTGCSKNKRALKTQKFGSIMFLYFKSFYKYEKWLWLSPNYRTT